MTIGFIGNFEPPYSTENDRKWSFLKLGHDVVTFQENMTDPQEIIEFLPKLDLLLYSHTHGWKISNLKEVFEIFKDKGIPTASVHLDRWAWLEREKDIGEEATWKTQYQFMADFSPEAQELYKKHNLNAYYLKPGVIERDCYLATPDLIRFPHEIVFVGSKGYHKEYPYRAEMIEFLQKTYKERFGHYGNDGLGVLRGHDLNVLMATAKIVVGDSCFGSRPNYVSDRYYETRGRGGFLLHPFTEGVDNMGVAFFEAENLKALKLQIDYYLNNSYEREQRRMLGFNYVKDHETYTNRAEEMLKKIYAS